jgi:SAM-dependent methyltransferase
MATWAARARLALHLLKMSEFAVAAGRCPFCGPTLFVKLNDMSGPRCARCSAGIVQLSFGWALRDAVADIGACDVCELSSLGPVAMYLRRAAKSVATSEYFADVPSGTLHDGVRCEDVQQLSYPDASFDLVTHTEVLEHVPDDARALAELLRVLRPGGTMIFTVPMHGGPATVVRAKMIDGEIEHVLEPVYHYDPLSADGVLAFRDYGGDIVDRVRAAGFVEARIVAPSSRLAWLGGLPVILARKER